MKDFAEAYKAAHAKAREYTGAKRAGWAEPGKRRTAAENMKCPYHYPASLLGTGVVIMDEIGPWPTKGKGR